MNEYIYTLGDIIVALSDEYKKNQIMLDGLKKHVVISDKKISDIRFYTITDKNPDIGFKIIEKNVFGKKNKDTNIDVNDAKTNGIVLRSNNDFYLDTPFYHVEVKDKRNFDESMKEITNSDFLRECYADYECESKKLVITPQFLELVDKGKKNTIRLVYDSPYNCVTVKSDKKVSIKDLKNIFNFKILATALDPYFYNLVLANTKTSKVITPNYNGKKFKTKNASFDMVQTKNEVAFVKKLGK